MIFDGLVLFVASTMSGGQYDLRISERGSGSNAAPISIRQPFARFGTKIR
jgi:hypothetical protein